MAPSFSGQLSFSAGRRAGGPQNEMSVKLPCPRMQAILIQGDEEAIMTRVLTAVLHKEGDLYVADCPEVGTVSQGATIEEALGNLREATELYLEEFPLEETQRPFVTTFEVAVHA